MDCIFCRIASGALASDIVYQDEEVVAFRDTNAQAPVHILVVPRRHIDTLLSFTEEDAGLLGRIQLVAAKVARAEGIAQDGFRTVINCNAQAGQTVFHLHLHLLGGRAMGWPPG